MDDWIAITSDPSGTSFRIRQDNGYTLRIALWALGFVVVYYVFLFAGIKNVNPDGAFGFLPFLGILFGIAAFPLQFGLLFLLPFALLQKLWVKKEIDFSIKNGDLNFSVAPRKDSPNFSINTTSLSVGYRGRGFANRGYAVYANYRGRDLIVAEALSFSQANFLFNEILNRRSG